MGAASENHTAGKEALISGLAVDIWCTQVSYSNSNSMSTRSVLALKPDSLTHALGLAEF